MSSGSTCNSLPGKGASDSNDSNKDPKSLRSTETMNNTQQTGVGASDSHPSSPQTASQPTSSQEGIEPKGDNVANNGERASVNGSDEGTRNEQQTMSMVDSMRFVTNLMKKLGIATIAKSLHRGHQYEILKQHPRALRTYESTHVDGAWILGDVDDGMADLTYAERLRHLGVLGGQNIRTQSLAFHHSESADGQASTQSSHASNLHINVPSAPGMVVLAPPHSPDAVFAGFRDPLMYNIRLPLPYMSLAVPVRRLAEAQERWREAVENGAKYKVPGSDVEIDVWKVKNAMPSTLLGTNDGVRHAFDFLFKAISSSQYAIDRKIALELPYHSLAGNARLEWKDHPTERLELQWDQVREIHRDGEFEEIEIEQLGTTGKEALRRSAFHPNRLHTFLIVFNPKTTYGYCLPASKLSSDYWSGEQFIYIPASEVAEFRFTPTEPDWFADLHRRIILPNAQSERPEHVFPEDAVPEDYAITEEDEHGIDEPLSEQELSSYPWWKIERWNLWAAHTGYGMYVPLGHDCKFASVVWMAYRWSMEDKMRYHTTQELPVSFHQGDVHPRHLVLPIRFLLVREGNIDSHPKVSGWDLEDEGLRCLFYADCDSYHSKHIEQKGLLIRSQDIIQGSLQKPHTGSIGERVSSETRAAQTNDGASMEPGAPLVDLEHCLKVVPSEIYVHGTKDFNDLIVNSASNGYFDYFFSARDIWQKLADEWILSGAIEVPVKDVNEPTD